MLEEVHGRDANDRADPASSNPPPATTSAAREVPPEQVEHFFVEVRNGNTPTIQPYPKVNDRPNKQPDRQGAVPGGAKILDELVEVRTDRLLSQSNACLVQKEDCQASGIMRSCCGHLDAATNDSQEKIIPGSA